MRQFLVSLMFALVALGPALAADDDSTNAKAAFRAAYASYNAALEAGDAEAALAAATEALDLGPQVFADDSPSLAALYVNRGNALLGLRRRSEAVVAIEKGVERFENIYGEDDERLIDPLWSLADAYRSAFGEDRDRAWRTMVKVVRLVKLSEGQGSHLFAEANQKLGEALSMAGDKRGRRYLKIAYEGFKALYDDQAYQTGLSAFWLGKLDYATKYRKRAEQEFLEALQIFEKTTPPGREFDIGAHSYLVRLYEERGDSESATVHCQAISLIRPKAEVDGHFPLYRKPAIYPARAVRAGKEGTVVVEFTVTKSGTVTEPRVVTSEGIEAFQKAALDAVVSWRFAPAVADGKLVDSPNVRNIITFEMAKD